MKTFWDQRYAEEHFVYGKEPNAFFRQELDRLTPGRLLLPADGEGRNAVYAASRGWQVDAFDYSQSAQQKATQLAAEKNVSIRYFLADIQSFEWPADAYDVIGLFFVHLQPDSRPFLHQKVMHSLKKGGTLILEGFAKEQLPLSSGGPKNPDMLFSKAMLEEDFSAYPSHHLTQESVTLEEGVYHNGQAEVIRMLVKK
jgi:SAM-dependent methyltransferase